MPQNTKQTLDVEPLMHIKATTVMLYLKSRPPTLTTRGTKLGK
jgi:hypothetical protein